MPFVDRSDAGRRLAARLMHLRGRRGSRTARGRVPVAFEVARALHVPLDVIVVRKLDVPFQPELGIGAIGEGGVSVINHGVVRMADVTPQELAAVEKRERAELDRRVRRFRGDQTRVPLAGRTAVVVDDGIATGSTVRAAGRVARAQGAVRVVLARTVVAVLSVVAMALVGCGAGTPRSATAPSTSAPTSVVPSTSLAPSSSPAPSSSKAPQPPPTSGPKGGPVPAGFVPVSVTFVSLVAGWVLGTAPCASPPCTSLVRTNDAGKTWVGIPAPRVALDGNQPGGVRRVRFADADNGWAFGPELWATHDGGSHWSKTTLPGVAPDAPISDLQAANGTVHAAVLDAGRVSIESSAVASEAWKKSPTTVELGAGPVPQAQIVLQGSTGWLLEVNRTVISGARLSGGQWVPWAPPCADVGGPAHLAASTPSDIVAICDEGIWAGGPRAERAYLSADAGATFRQTAVPLPIACCVAVAATARPGTVVSAGSMEDGTAVLLATFDQGATWAPAYRGPGRQSWGDLGFTSAAQGVAITRTSDGQSGTLLMTFDGGHTWTPTAFR